ncbi:MAG: PEGA domain-containing protein [Myxococcota bacterium]
MLVVGGLGLALVALVGIGLFAFTRTTPPPLEPEPTVLLEPVPEPAPLPDPEPAAQALVQSVLLESDPGGAEVLRDGAFLGVTPVNVELRNGSVTLTVQAVGYEPRDVLLDGTVDRTLVPLKRRASRPGPVPTTAVPDPKPAEPDPKPAEPAPKPGGLDVPKTDLRDPFAR